jgi:hypothetical protein
MKSKAYIVNRLLSIDPTLDPEELTKMTVVSLLELTRRKRNPVVEVVEEPEEPEEEPEDLMTSILGCRS